jgi:hypothetical protein
MRSHGDPFHQESSHWEAHGVSLQFITVTLSTSEKLSDLAATVYHHLGISLDAQWINPLGRPIPIVTGEGRPIAELIFFVAELARVRVFA